MSNEALLLKSGPHCSERLPLPQVACMQFINIVVHSVEDMNFRVHLQYEFTKLGLEEFLQVSYEPGKLKGFRVESA